MGAVRHTQETSHGHHRFLSQARRRLRQRRHQDPHPQRQVGRAAASRQGQRQGSGLPHLLPQGSKLLGSYDSQVSAGQSRILLAWTRLILPNGRSLVLQKLPGGDAEGYGGLQDKVNHHWGTVAGAALLSTLLGVGVQLGASDADNNIVSAFRFGAASSLNQAGQQIVGRALTIPPTLTIRPGAPVRVMVNRDLVLEPYQS
jgi:type IV secretory pathway VirB10-like protein